MITIKQYRTKTYGIYSSHISPPGRADNSAFTYTEVEGRPNNFSAWWLYPSVTFAAFPGDPNITVLHIMPTGPETVAEHFDFFFMSETLAPCEQDAIDYVDKVLQRAATAGDGWLTYFYSPEAFTKSWDKIRAFAREGGKDPDKLLNASQLPIMVGPSKGAVRDEMMDWLNKEWDFPEHSDCSRDSAIMGSVDECVEQLKAHLAVGVQKIIFVPYKYRMDQVETIARDIIPRLKK